MARTFKRGGVWCLDYRDENGVRQRPATSAKGKGAANNLLTEKLAQVQRIKLGLDAAPIHSTLTLGELCTWWLENRCPAASLENEVSRLKVNVQETHLRDLVLEKATSGVFEDYFVSMQKGGAKPATINHLRSTLRNLFNSAAKPNASTTGAKWGGRNPLPDTTSRSVPKKNHPTLKFEEVPPMLAQVPPQWVGFFAVGIYLALRKGEICGLQKSHVDLSALEVMVAASYEAEGTKGRDGSEGGIHALPIEPVLLPYIKEAMRTSPSEYLFPGPDGGMRDENSCPEGILRSALNRAGLVDGYKHMCRRCGYARMAGGTGGGKRGGSRDNPFAAKKKHAELHPDSTLRHCPQCAGKLWASPRPRGNMRFHDLRHSTATILLRSGAPMYRVQRILRHAQITTTIGTYGHLETADLRGSLGVFNAHLPSSPPPEPPTAPAPKLKIVGTNTAHGTEGIR